MWTRVHTGTADSEAGGAVSVGFATFGAALRVREAGTNIPGGTLTLAVLEPDDLEHAEHWT